MSPIGPIAIAVAAALVATWSSGVHAQSAQAPAAAGMRATVRPEVGKPLQAAQELMKNRRHAEALAKIAETDAVAGKTPHELVTIARMRGAAAMSAGDSALAIRSFEAVIASGQLPAAERLQMLQAMAGLAYRAKDHPKAAALAQRYLKEGGDDTPTRNLLAQSLYLSGRHAEAAKAMQAVLQAEDSAGRVPTEGQLQLLASCYAKLDDAPGYQRVLERLVAHHPKKDYWADLLRRVPQRAGFASRLSLDVYRLQWATGTLTNAPELVEMVQLALQESSPAEAKKLIDGGFASELLGSGADAERHRRLRDLAAKALADEQRSLANVDREAADAAAAPTGIGLYNLGWTLFHHGQADKGLAMMELGLRKGGLKRPEDARLHYGVAALQAGQKMRARQALRAVQGEDGTAELARLWLVHAQAQAPSERTAPSPSASVRGPE